jgi:hypothetical protein
MRKEDVLRRSRNLMNKRQENSSLVKLAKEKVVKEQTAINTKRFAELLIIKTDKANKLEEKRVGDEEREALMKALYEEGLQEAAEEKERVYKRCMELKRERQTKARIEHRQFIIRREKMYSNIYNSGIVHTKWQQDGYSINANHNLIAISEWKKKEPVLLTLHSYDQVTCLLKGEKLNEET